MAMGGVGEAMLLGAAMGGGSAALTGGDPLKGALLGGLTGGAGAGIGGALSGAGTNAALTAAGTEAATGAALNAAGTSAATGAGAAGTTAAMGPGVVVNPLGAEAANLSTTGANLFGSAPTGFPGMGGQTAAQQFTASMNPAAMAPTGVPGATIAPGVGSFTPPAPTGGISNIPVEGGTFTEGMARFANDPLASMKANKGIAFASALQGATGARKDVEGPEEYDGPLKRFRFNPETYRAATFAEGGIADLAAGGYDRMVGEQPMYQALAKGGISDLGGYSDYAGGGRMLKGPGDGMSDSIPASIAGKRPARLARDEFVVPADVVSGLGNGSSDAGAKHLYAMMDRVRQARTGSKKQGKEINARRFVPA
jgi:hypothetical protein